MKQIRIANIDIRKDAEGRYCLDDLHKSAGGESIYQPAEWLRLRRTKKLITVVATDGMPGTVQSQPVRVYPDASGINDIFICEDLMYSYAMWISDSFTLQVIRAVHNRPSQVDSPMTYSEALLQAGLRQREIEQMERILLSSPSEPIPPVSASMV